MLHSLPEDTFGALDSLLARGSRPYSGGCYHGRLLFPGNYPHAPPAVVMTTPNGRLEVGCRLCPWPVLMHIASEMRSQHDGLPP